MRDVYLEAVERWGAPDILHAHVSLPGGYLAARLGQEFAVPVIVQEHYSGFLSEARFWWRKGCFVKEMGRHIQGFYAVSPSFAERINRSGLLRVSGVLPNPIDTDLFRLENRRINPKVFRIVTTGDMGWGKGTDILFEALRMLPRSCDWHLTLFGDTRERKRFENWLRDPAFAERVSLPGKVPPTELAREYSRSDLFVVSSRIETANVSMLEAMACGMPVVATRCGGPEGLLDTSVGLLVENEKSSLLAQAILTMFERQNDYSADRLRQFVLHRYSKPAVRRLVLNAYESAGADRSSP